MSDHHSFLLSRQAAALYHQGDERGDNEALRQAINAYRPRQGKKAIAFWVEPAASTQVRVAPATMGRTVQDIMGEALDDWFAKHGLHRLAASEAEAA